MLRNISLLICTFALYSQGIEYFVSPTGTSTTGCVTIDNPCSSITAAVKLASDGDLVHLLNGYFTGALNRNITIDKSISIIGESDQVVIDLQGSGRAFSLTNSTISFTLEEVTIINGFADVGGVLFLQGPGNVNIDTCTFNNNTATLIGGALSFAAGSTVVITDSTFFSNQAMDEGGSIVFDEISWATVSNSFFLESTANDGGAIFVAESTVNISQSTFWNNYAADQGGSIFATQASHILLEDSSMVNTTASSEGGAIYSVASSLVTIVSSNITYAVALNGGAVIADTYGGVKIVNSILNQNAALNGAAAYVGAGKFTSIDSQITYNTALQHAGAVFCGDEGKVILRSTMVTNNRANSDGGAIYTKSRSDITLVDTTISSNSAGGSGGGIFCSDSKVHVNNSVISDNTADESSDSSNMFCSSYPGGTSCQIDGDSEYTANICGLPPGDSSNLGGLPLIAVIGIALGGAGLIICTILLIGCIIWKRKASVEQVSWKQIKVPKKDKKEDDMELLEDYD